MNDIIGFIAAFLTTFAFLPQAIKTWRTKSTGDLSPIMYTVLVIGIIAWLVYGLIITNWPMILANVVTLSFNLVIFYFVLFNKTEFKIEHIALWVDDLEKMKEFYSRMFNAKAGKKYINDKKEFQSYFLTLSGNTRIELMQSTKKTVVGKTMKHAHIAISVGSKTNVEEVTQRMIDEGFAIVSQPRTTGDGYYESVIEDPEKNLVELISDK